MYLVKWPNGRLASPPALTELAAGHSPREVGCRQISVYQLGEGEPTSTEANEAIGEGNDPKKGKV